MSESGDYIITTEKHKDKVIAGVDEVARGTFIGPVIAACVVLPKSFPDDTYKQIKDSKKLSEKKVNINIHKIDYFLNVFQTIISLYDELERNRFNVIIIIIIFIFNYFYCKYNYC